MSKPISFGFGKPKSLGTDRPTTLKTTSISLPAKKPPTTLTSSRSALRTEDDDDLDEEEPKHESVTGFSSSGAILSKPAEVKQERVIENPGNQDWRQRGKTSTQEARQRQDVIMVEKDEVSTASGLQFATSDVGENGQAEAEAITQNGNLSEKQHPVSADEEALQALLGDGDRPRGTTVIQQQANTQLRPHDESDDFRADVASRPDSSTLNDYAAMPVEEFGMAMLRGMGKKRRANGEVINFDSQDEPSKKFRKQEGFLGIGAKAAPGMDGVELGAWGKADMRKNSKGAGFFTPLMVKNRDTGETITEDELERRKRDANGNGNRDGDWRERRDRNLAQHGRDKEDKNQDRYRDEMNGFSRKGRDVSGDRDSSRSRRDRDDSDYNSSRSRKHRSRSRERRRRDEDERYESSSSRKDRDRHRDRERDHDRDRERERERDYHRRQGDEREDRKYRDRR